jgi:hypothetical protein
MAQNNGIVDCPTVIRGPLMEIRATDSDIFYFEQYVLLADFGDGNFSDFYRSLGFGIIDNGS